MKPEIKTGDFVIYAKQPYEVADTSNPIHVGIYDEPPSKHIDYVCWDNVELVEQTPVEAVSQQSKDVMKACCGFIEATEVARKAVSMMESALKRGVAHARPAMEASLPILKKRLKECCIDYAGPVHINSNVRLFDLVRYMRSELHQADLINDSEYFWLCAEAELATSPEGGSPSRDRLEDYDELREQLNAQIKHSEKLAQLLEDPLRIGGCDWPPNGWCEDAQRALREHEALKKA